MSKRNFKTRVERLQESTAREKQRFSIRKLSVGAASVLLGTTLFFGAGKQVSADTTSNPTDAQSNTGGNSVVESNNDQLKKQHNISTTTQSKVKQAKNTDTDEDVTSDTTKNADVAGFETSDGGVSTDTDSHQGDSIDQDSSNPTHEEAPEQEVNTDTETTTYMIDGSSSDTQNHDFKDSKVQSDSNNAAANAGIMLLSDDSTSVEDASEAQAKTVKVTIKGTMYGDNFTLDIPEGEDIQTAIQNEIDKDNAIQNKPDSTNMSPLVTQLVQSNSSNADLDGTGVLKDEYAAWKRRKEKEFPLAGYTLNNISQDTNGNYVVQLDSDSWKQFDGNTWREYSRDIVYRKYYGHEQYSGYTHKIYGHAVQDTGDQDLNYSGAYVPNNLSPSRSISAKPSDLNSDSTTLNVDAPSSDHNYILDGDLIQRRYYPDTGTVKKFGDQPKPGIFVIQYDGEKISSTNSKFGNSWNTLAQDLDKTGNNYGDDKTYGTDYYGSGTFVKGMKENGDMIPAYDPPTVYVIYYHNQPVQVQFEDITDGEKILSTFNAKNGISWKHSDTPLATRQYSTTIDGNGNAVLTNNESDYVKDSTPYSYKTDTYTFGNLTNDANATDANTKINELDKSKGLNYKDILQAYLDNGYVLVSEDDDHLTYNANNVWSSDPTDTENDGHKLNPLTRKIKLRRVAHQVGPDDRTVTRTVHYVKDDANKTSFDIDTTQSAHFKVDSYWVDKSNTPVTAKPYTYKDSSGNTVQTNIVTGTTGMPKWQITTNNPSTDVDISSTNSFATFVDKNKDEITDKDDTVWVLNKAKSQEANQDILSTDPTEWNGYSTTDNGKTYTKDLTLVYDQKAYAHTETKQAQRIVHYVADERQGLTQENMPELKDSDVQTINFKATYYTTDKDGKGKHVAVKNIGTAEDPIYVVDSTKEPTEIWTVDTSKNNNGTDISDDQASYDQVTDDEITNGKLPGTWTVTEATKNKASKEDISNNIENNTKENVYLVYTKNVNADVNFYDVTNGIANETSIASTIADKDDQGKTGQAIHWLSDPQETINRLTSQGYVQVTTPNTNTDQWSSDLKYGNDDSHYNVYFIHKNTVVSPSETPEYPTNVKKEDKKATKETATHIVKYFDADTLDANGNPTAIPEDLAKTVTQTVTWTRYAVYDNVDGSFLGYAKLGEDGPEKDEYGNTVVDSSLTDDNSWTITRTQDGKAIDGNTAEFDAVPSNNLSSSGYKAERSLNRTTYDANDGGASVAAKTANFGDNTEDDVYYFHDIVPVISTSTDVPKGKDGNPVVDKSTLQRSVSRKIHFVERGTNKSVAEDVDQSVNFNLTAIVDKVTGKVLGYDTTGDNKVDYQDINQAWQNVPAKTLGETITPKDYGYDHHDLSSVKETLVNANSNPDDVTVEYWNDQGSFKVVYIDQDNNNQPIVGTEYDAPTEDFNTSITYKTQPTIDQLKDQGYELVTDGFTDQSGTTYNKDNNGKVFKVILKHTTESVTSKNPKTPGTKITKDGNSKYPKEVDKNNLEVPKSRKITYVDGVTGKPVDGSPNGKSEEDQSITFFKNPIIDKVTGKVLGYDVTGDGQVDTQDPNEAWYTEDNEGKRTPGNKATLPELDSKYPSKLGYDEYDKSSVPAVDVTPNTDLQNDQVKYYHYTKGTPKSKTFTRTIKYVDEVTGDLIPEDKMPNGKNDVTQSIKLTRTPYLDRKGNVVGYDVDGKFVPSSETDGWTTNKMNEVPSPDLSKYGYTSATSTDVEDPSLVPETTITENSPKDQTITIKYGHQTTFKEISKGVSRTITYIDRDTGKPVNGSPEGDGDYTQTVTFKMNEICDAVTNEVLGYDTTGDDKVDFKDEEEAWKNVPAQTLSQVKSATPQNIGYDENDTPTVSSETVTADSKLEPQVVQYWRNPAPKTYTWTVEYKTTDGKTIKDPVTVGTSYKIGEGFDVTKQGEDTYPEEITKDGKTYKLINTDNPSGKFNNDNETTTLIYKEVEKPTTPPVDQKAKVKIVDKTTKKILTYFTDNNGKNGDPINFDGSKDAVASYLDLGYKFDSAVQDSDKSSIGKDADSIKYPNFDQDPDNSQDFTIYLVHDTENKTKTGTTTSTVHYEVSDGKTPAPKDNKQTITWTRTVTTDRVTGETTETPWKTDKSYTAVKTPELTGYTPTIDTVSAETPVYGKDPYTVVTYNPKKIVDQVAKLRIFDKTTKKQLTDFVSDHGQAGQGISFSNSDQVLQLLLKNGYVFDSAVQDSDQSSIGKDASSIKYPNFDNVPKNSQDFTIYLVHGTEEVPSHDQSTAYVHYVVAGNDPAKPQVPADNTTKQTITWTKTDTIDSVTGETIKEGNWIPNKTTFDNVDSPKVDGYTPDQSSVEFTKPVRGENQPVLVVYTKNPTPSPEPDPTPVVPTTPDTYKVTVDYVDEHGNKIKDPTVEKDLEDGSSYNTNTKETKPETITTKDGKTYKLTTVKNGSDPESSTIQGQDVKITYVYKLVEQDGSTPAKQEHTITVHYIDEHGNEIKKPITEQGKDGDKYDVTDKKDSTITKDGKTYYYKKTTGDSEEGIVNGKDVNVYYVYYTKLGTHTDEPTNPKKDKKISKHEKTVKTSTKTNNKSMEEVQGHHENLANKYRSTTPIHADNANAKSSDSVAMPKSETVDGNGKPYSANAKTLPQTGEKDDSAMATAGIMTAMLGGVISAYGAGRRKKRRH